LERYTLFLNAAGWWPGFGGSVAMFGDEHPGYPDDLPTYNIV